MRISLVSMLCTIVVSLCRSLPATAGQVHAFETNSFKQIISDHKGKPFVVVVWSLDCDYCQPSFQTLTEAQRRQQFDVVTIATDRASDTEATRLIEKKMRLTGLTAETWAFGAAAPEQLRYAIDPKWRGEMPRSYWFNLNGNVISHSGVITKENVERLSGRNLNK